MNIQTFNSLCIEGYLSGEPVTIATVAKIASGIGFGTNKPQIRAIAEALERFWLLMGPTPRAHAYFFRDSPTESSFTYSPKEYADSSGTAIHLDPTKAIRGACLEFIERQSLFAHWRFGTPGTLVCHPTSVSHLEKSGYALQFREISIFEGISVVLCIYSSSECSIHYAAGAAASPSLTNACSKAYAECLQAKLLMQDNLFRKATNRQLLDSIQEYYVKCNTPETAGRWPTPTPQATRVDNSITQSVDPIHIVSTLKNPPYLLVDQIEYNGKLWTVARLYSDEWQTGLLDCRLTTPQHLPHPEMATRFVNEPVPFG